jgi:hypothetical protein
MAITPILRMLRQEDADYRLAYFSSKQNKIKRRKKFKEKRL